MLQNEYTLSSKLRPLAKRPEPRLEVGAVRQVIEKVGDVNAKRARFVLAQVLRDETVSKNHAPTTSTHIGRPGAFEATHSDGFGQVRRCGEPARGSADLGCL